MNGLRHAPRTRVVLSMLPLLAAVVMQWFYRSSLAPFTWSLFYPAVLLSAWLGGLRAGLATTAVSLVTVWWFYLEPRFSFSLERPGSIVTLLSFAFMGVLISLLFGRLQSALTKARASLVSVDELNSQLEERVRERTGQLAETTVAAQKSEARFHRLFDNMLEGCQIIAFDWSYLYVNDSNVRHSRAPREHLLGRKMTEVFPGLEQTEIFATLDRCMRERIPERNETLFEYPDGSRAWFEVSVQPAPEGIFILSIDVTERKRTETALRESDERFRQITETLPQLIWTATSSGACDFLSGQWEQYTGVAATSQIDDWWLTRVHADDRSRVTEEWSAAVAGNVAQFHTEFRLQDRGGNYRWFEMRATSLRDERGLVVKWFGANMDIDDRRRAQELQLRSQKMEALGSLAGGIAHDFNNILLAIRGNARLAIADLAAGDPALQCLGEIDRAGIRASDLVRRILAFSRQEEPRREVIEMLPVIDEAVKLLRSTLPAMIELRRKSGCDVPTTVADSSQLHQIIMNLVTNSAHAIGSHPGIIDIDLERALVDEGLAQVTPGLHAGEYVRISVSDNGCGIDERTMQRIFDPFFTTKPVGEGTGLGLSVVDGIMKSHGGAVTVYSQPGRGTAFRLYFPASRHATSHVQVIRELIPHAQGKRVLYVDDDAALVFLAERTLRRLGYEVTGCIDPREALSRFRERPLAYDVVVTDLSMPVMLGYDLAREMLVIRPELPIVIMSGYIRAEDQEMATQVGVAAIILKPDTIEELGATLDRLIRRQPAHQDQDIYRKEGALS